ncbi:MAG: hypothetical protein A2252_09190 [Elusimicrobia bacterium RIFOXYA2_FULL_39_19]|nr:MAG: hypothetical protein A2252_09190 [Elusimicrobia bacterium RIFOXYA2_FULL_39_19]
MNDGVMKLLSEVIDLLKLILPMGITGFVGYFYGKKSLKEQKKMEFIERQINELYSPLLGYHMKMRAEGELRVEIQIGAKSAWQKICDNQPKPFKDSGTYYEPFRKIIEHDNNKFRTETLPLYDKMLQIFTEKQWLADPSTQQYYSGFYKFIDIWHRWLDKSIPAEVLEEIDYQEEKLQPFYNNLENQVKLLKNILSGK